MPTGEVFEPVPDVDRQRRGALWWVAVSILVIGLLGLLVFVTLSAIQFYTPQTDEGLVDFDLSPDGFTIVFTSASGELYTYGLLTHDLVRISPAGAGGATPRYSPDGKRIVFAGPSARGGSWSLYSLEMGPYSLQRLTADPASNDIDPSFSKDGDHIVFARGSADRRSWDIWEADYNGQHSKRLTNKSFSEAGAPQFWDRDHSVIFTAARKGGGPLRLLTVSCDGKGKVEWLRTGPPGQDDVRDLSVSPDRQMLAFVSDRNPRAKQEIYLASIDGTDVRPLGVSAVSPITRRPVISPDDRTIYFLTGRDRDGKGAPLFSLWASTLAGVKAPLTDARLFQDPYTWSFAQDGQKEADGLNRVTPERGR